MARLRNAVGWLAMLNGLWACSSSPRIDPPDFIKVGPPGEGCPFGGIALHLPADAGDFNVCNGSPGDAGVAGHSALATTHVEAPGSICPRGGVALRVGLDENDDGVLQEDEVKGSPLAVCNGETGATGRTGADGMVALTSVGPAFGCSHGGTLVTSGRDIDGDGTLGSTEVRQRALVCDGAPGRGGDAGAPGHSALVTLTLEPPGEHCPQGGYAVASGVDANDDGRLEEREDFSVAFICHGAPGQNGAPGEPGQSLLLVMVAESAGAHCAEGGTAVKSGADANGDGVLQDAEVTSMAYVCNGGPGAKALVRVVAEPPGPNCVSGGTAVKSGADANGDGVLQGEEVSSTAYVCNGVPGAKSLVRVVAEPPGPNCVSGGTAVKSGADANGDGVLQDTEVTSTAYMCNGGPGAKELVRVVAEPPGPNCVSGGMAVQRGVDVDQNGVLDAKEVTATDYLCTVLGSVSSGWSYGSLGQASGDIFSNAFWPVGGPVRILKTTAASRLKVTITDTLRTNYWNPRGASASLCLRMNGTYVDCTAQYTRAYELGGSSEGTPDAEGGGVMNDFRLPYANVYVSERLAPGVYEFDAFVQGAWTGMLNGMSAVGLGDTVRGMLVEELDSASSAVNVSDAGIVGVTSTSPISAPGRTLSYAKRSAETLLKVTLADTLGVGSQIGSVASGGVLVKMDGKDTLCTRAQSVSLGSANGANVDHPFVATCIVAGASAGTHVFTVWLRATAGEVSLGSGRRQATLLVEEVAPTGRAYQVSARETGDLTGGFVPVPEREVRYEVSAAAKALKVTYSDDFRAVAGCNDTAGFFRLYVDGVGTSLTGGAYLRHSGAGASNQQTYPIHETWLLQGLAPGAHLFSIASTTYNLAAEWPKPCGANHFGWGRGQALLLVEELR